MNIRSAWPVWLLLAPGMAAAQEPRLQGRVSDATRVEVETVLDSARMGGLPTEPIVDRALEGAAKGAPGDLIVRAVRRLWSELAAAREAFGDEATSAELTAGASALRAGATSDDLTDLRLLRADQPITVAAATLADLVAAGVPADTAIAAVFTLASAARDADYMTFRRSVERDIAMGASPAAALGVRLSAAAEAASPNSLENRDAAAPRRRKP